MTVNAFILNEIFFRANEIRRLNAATGQGTTDPSKTLPLE